MLLTRGLSFLLTRGLSLLLTRGLSLLLTRGLSLLRCDSNSDNGMIRLQQDDEGTNNESALSNLNV